MNAYAQKHVYVYIYQSIHTEYIQHRKAKQISFQNYYDYHHYYYYGYYDYTTVLNVFSVA